MQRSRPVHMMRGGSGVKRENYLSRNMSLSKISEEENMSKIENNNEVEARRKYSSEPGLIRGELFILCVCSKMISFRNHYSNDVKT